MASMTGGFLGCSEHEWESYIYVQDRCTITQCRRKEVVLDPTCIHGRIWLLALEVRYLEVMMFLVATVALLRSPPFVTAFSPPFHRMVRVSGHTFQISETFQRDSSIYTRKAASCAITQYFGIED
jgi:hypothetical protein